MAMLKHELLRSGSYSVHYFISDSYHADICFFVSSVSMLTLTEPKQNLMCVSFQVIKPACVCRLTCFHFLFKFQDMNVICSIFSQTNSFFYTTTFVPFRCLNHRYSILKGKGRKGSTKATGGVYFWLTHMLFRCVQPARPKGCDADKPEVTLRMSSGAVSLQKYLPHTQIQLNSGGSQGQICGYAPSFALSMTKWALQPLPGGYTTPQSTRWLQYLRIQWMWNVWVYSPWMNRKPLNTTS